MAAAKDTVLENDRLRIVASTRAGGVSILSVYDKKNRKEWIYTDGNRIRSRAGKDTYDNQYFGGCEFIFPNDLPVSAGNLEYRDHGFLWTANYVNRGVKETEGAYTARYSGFIKELDIRSAVTIRLHKNSQVFEFGISLLNHSKTVYPFLLRLHPSFQINRDCKMLLGGERICFEGAQETSYCSFEAQGPIQDYPLIDTDKGRFSIESLAGTDISELFCHITGSKGGYFLKDGKDKIRISYRKEDFPYLTVYYIGGEKRVVMIEPATDAVFDLKRSIFNGTARLLYPEKEMRYTVKFEAG